MLIYNDAEFRKGEIYIRSLDTSIPLSRSMWRSIFRQVFLYLLVCSAFWSRVLTGRRAPYKIGFYPARPKPWYKLWNITKWMGFAYDDDFSNCDVLFYFEDVTEAEPNEELLANSNKKVLNGTCVDIGKEKVQDVFENVFGYALGVDPLTFEGRVVQKSNINAEHDGKIIDCPVQTREDGYCYQRFVENCYDGNMVEDIRVPIVGDKIPVVYLKRRPIDKRFANENTDCIMVETGEALSASEVESLIQFSKEMGLDFGGLDVLRSRECGKIFVVDVNKTDMGPPIPLKTKKKIEACDRLGEAFVKMVEGYAA